MVDEAGSFIACVEGHKRRPRGSASRLLGPLVTIRTEGSYSDYGEACAAARQLLAELGAEELGDHVRVVACVLTGSRDLAWKHGRYPRRRKPTSGAEPSVWRCVCPEASLKPG